tara:strand:- start:4511 stop:5002 length:492 start_codon:yes stop_codon:yes gene_type:complete
MIKDLTYNQTMNLIHFTCLMTWEASKPSPDYVLEKWNTYIGINPLRIGQWDEGSVYFTASQEVGNYCIDWGTATEDYDSYKNILMYIFSFNSIFSCTLSELIRNYRLYINESGINDKLIKHDLHPLLKEHLDKWVNIDGNKEILQTLQREQDINDILNEKGDN